MPKFLSPLLNAGFAGVAVLLAFAVLLAIPVDETQADDGHPGGNYSMLEFLPFEARPPFMVFLALAMLALLAERWGAYAAVPALILALVLQMVMVAFVFVAYDAEAGLAALSVMILLWLFIISLFGSKFLGMLFHFYSEFFGRVGRIFGIVMLGLLGIVTAPPLLLSIVDEIAKEGLGTLTGVAISFVAGCFLGKGPQEWHPRIIHVIIGLAMTAVPYGILIIPMSWWPLVVNIVVIMLGCGIAYAAWHILKRRK